MMMKPYIDKNGHAIGTPSCPKCPGKKHPFPNDTPKKTTNAVNPARSFQVGLPDNPLVPLAKSFGIWVGEGLGMAVTFGLLTGNSNVAGAIWFAYIAWRIVRAIGLDFLKRIGKRAVSSPATSKSKQKEQVVDYS